MLDIRDIQELFRAETARSTRTAGGLKSHLVVCRFTDQWPARAHQKVRVITLSHREFLKLACYRVLARNLQRRQHILDAGRRLIHTTLSPPPSSPAMEAIPSDAATLLATGKEPATTRRHSREYMIGIGLLLVVVFLWTASNFITQVCLPTWRVCRDLKDV